MHFIDFFLDPVLRSSTWGCMLMAASTSLVGVIAFLKKRSLLGETISHATYPGVVLGVVFFSIFFPNYESYSVVFVIIFAYLSAISSMKLLSYMENRFKVQSDASLCFILASFFGFGVLFASHAQLAFTNHYKKIQMYIYGQTATMLDVHVLIYAILTFFISLTIYFLYRPIQAVLFDQSYAKSININVERIDKIFNHLLVIALVAGIRSVGIVLASGMLIAPVIAARQFTDKLSSLFIISAIIGALSSFFGNYLSVQISFLTSKTLPSGPIIVLISALVAFIALLLAPKNGFLFRLIRIFKFKRKCLQENILKYMWKNKDKKITDTLIKRSFHINFFTLKTILMKMKGKKLIINLNERYLLTEIGDNLAANIIRLHRLWELYLSDHLGTNINKVHPSAEEMEHILTPEIERRLTRFLNNPKEDPHNQPIPQTKGQYL